jgi:hypothetical protein
MHSKAPRLAFGIHSFTGTESHFQGMYVTCSVSGKFSWGSVCRHLPMMLYSTSAFLLLLRNRIESEIFDPLWKKQEKAAAGFTRHQEFSVGWWDADARMFATRWGLTASQCLSLPHLAIAWTMMQASPRRWPPCAGQAATCSWLPVFRPYLHHRVLDLECCPRNPRLPPAAQTFDTPAANSSPICSRTGWYVDWYICRRMLACCRRLRLGVQDYDFVFGPTMDLPCFLAELDSMWHY